jgi:hypothetical protein
VLVVDWKRTPQIAVNDKSAIDLGKPFLLHREANRVKMDENRELAGCKPAWAGPGSCDEYPFASTMEGGLGAHIMGVPFGEQSRQGTDISGFYRRNKIGQGDPFLVAVINVSRVNGGYAVE